MGHLINYFIGQVLPNLIASSIWSIPALIYSFYKLDKRHKHREAEKEDRIHNHITQEIAKITPEMTTNGN